MGDLTCYVAVERASTGTYEIVGQPRRLADLSSDGWTVVERAPLLGWGRWAEVLDLSRHDETTTVFSDQPAIPSIVVGEALHTPGGYGEVVELHPNTNRVRVVLDRKSGLRGYTGSMYKIDEVLALNNRRIDS